MTATPAPALTAAELAVVQAFEDAPTPPEALKYRVAKALHDAEPRGWLNYADIALAVIRGEQ